MQRHGAMDPISISTVPKPWPTQMYLNSSNSTTKYKPNKPGTQETPTQIAQPSHRPPSTWTQAHAQLIDSTMSKIQQHLKSMPKLSKTSKQNINTYLLGYLKFKLSILLFKQKVKITTTWYDQTINAINFQYNFWFRILFFILYDKNINNNNIQMSRD